jgi:hypothetical protein
MSKKYCVVLADRLLKSLKIKDEKYQFDSKKNDIKFSHNIEVEWIQSEEFDSKDKKSKDPPITKHIIKIKEKYYKIDDKDLLSLHEYNYQDQIIDKTKTHKIFDSKLYFVIM